MLLVPRISGLYEPRTTASLRLTIPRFRDEIVADIFFWSQGCPTPSQLNSHEHLTPSQAGNPKNPPSVSRGRPIQEKASNSRLSQRMYNTPQIYNSQRQGS